MHVRGDERPAKYPVQRTRQCDIGMIEYGIKLMGSARTYEPERIRPNRPDKYEIKRRRDHLI